LRFGDQDFVKFSEIDVCPDLPALVLRKVITTSGAVVSLQQPPVPRTAVFTFTRGGEPLEGETGFGALASTFSASRWHDRLHEVANTLSMAQNV
jgi:hypothetical protein